MRRLQWGSSDVGRIRSRVPREVPSGVPTGHRCLLTTDGTAKSPVLSTSSAWGKQAPSSFLLGGLALPLKPRFSRVLAYPSNRPLREMVQPSRSSCCLQTGSLLLAPYGCPMAKRPTAATAATAAAIMEGGRCSAAARPLSLVSIPNHRDKGGGAYPLLPACAVRRGTDGHRYSTLSRLHQVVGGKSRYLGDNPRRLRSKQCGIRAGGPAGGVPRPAHGMAKRAPSHQPPAFRGRDRSRTRTSAIVLYLPPRPECGARAGRSRLPTLNRYPKGRSPRTAAPTASHGRGQSYPQAGSHDPLPAPRRRVMSPRLVL